MDIKHISFDLWNTIIRSNPNYTSAANEVWMEHLGIKNLLGGDDPEIYSIFLNSMIMTCNSYYNTISEVTGKHNTFKERLIYLYTATGIIPTVDFINTKSKSIYNSLEQVFLDNPSSLFDENTMDVLLELRDRGITTNIVSNVGFIKSQTLNKNLEILGVEDLFNFKIYTDQFPIHNIFQGVINKSGYTPDKIIHVGSDRLTNIKCEDVGIDFLQINLGEHYNITNILNYIQ